MGLGGTIWERITKMKLAVVEPKESAMFPQAAEDFKRKLSDPSANGAVFFAVCKYGFTHAINCFCHSSMLLCCHLYASHALERKN